jgi:hypothetical protein
LTLSRLFPRPYSFWSVVLAVVAVTVAVAVVVVRGDGGGGGEWTVEPGGMERSRCSKAKKGASRRLKRKGKQTRGRNKRQQAAKPSPMKRCNCPNGRKTKQVECAAERASERCRY